MADSKQRVAIGALFAGLVVLMLAACGSGTSTAPPAVGSVAPVLTSVAESSPTTSETSPVADGSFVMPNEVGKILQDAQDDVQRVSGNPLFFTSSTDATGAGRAQILDRNWQVCTQNVPAGTTVGADASIDFGTVKLDESCP